MTFVTTLKVTITEKLRTLEGAEQHLILLFPKRILWSRSTHAALTRAGVESCYDKFANTAHATWIARERRVGRKKCDYLSYPKANTVSNDCVSQSLAAKISRAVRKNQHA